MGQGIDDVYYICIAVAIINIKIGDLSDKCSKTHKMSDFNNTFKNH